MTNNEDSRMLEALWADFIRHVDGEDADPNASRYEQERVTFFAGVAGMYMLVNAVHRKDWRNTAAFLEAIRQEIESWNSQLPDDPQVIQ
jgi:hypothetical protein